MPIKDVFKVSRKTFFNPSEWIGFSTLKSANQTLWQVLKNLFSKPNQADIREETFEEAMERLDLTEENIQAAITNYKSYAWMFLIFGMLVFFYSFYLLFKYHYVVQWFLGMSASALFLCQAFKYDFWSFQMKRRELGVSFAEWKRNLLGE